MYLCDGLFKFWLRMDRAEFETLDRVSHYRSNLIARTLIRCDRMRLVMSAIGPKRTSLAAPHMSAFGGRADNRSAANCVCTCGAVTC